MLFSIPTNKPNIFIIKDQYGMIGRLNTNKDKAIVVFPKHPYKNKNKNIFEDSFGLLTELLLSAEFKFKLVIFHHEDKVYVTTREKLN